jgi:ribosomal peptide maturation radical SAM protein 1
VPDVALVSMPFGPVFAPSIGLSLLRAELAEHHVAARVHYFTIPFAESIGQAFYSDIAENGRPALEDLAGEWLFSSAVFETSSAGNAARYVKELLEDYYSDALIARLLRARERVDAFLDTCLEAVLTGAPRIVGFTSVFQQHTASLALARRIKQASPSTFVVFGGANCEGVMGAETVRSFPFVDAAVSGEADLVFPELVRRAIDGAPLAGLPGVRSRESVDREFAAGVFSNGPMVREMDRLPLPDYSDYFDQFRASRYRRGRQPSVFLETSRGCWWGERMHCTFCGLNGATMAFRSKSPARALAEVTELARRHPGCDIQAVDNILDLEYFEAFLPALAERRLKSSLFYETKSNLKKEQVRRLRGAGVLRIQPGIESFSDAVLKLMRKGVTGLQNIQLLKWCAELGVEPSWNFIWGFPGEPPEEYERLARLVPLLTHLPAPGAHAKIRLDRFSPNFFDAERLGFTDVKPMPAYAHVYPLPDSAVANLASYFTYGYAEPRDVDAYTRRLTRELQKWERPAKTNALFCVEAGEHLVIIDMRSVSQVPFRVLSGLARLLYRECDAVRDLSQLARVAAGDGAEAPTTDAIERLLAPLVEAGLLLREGSRCLALAVPVGEHVPPAANRRFATIVRDLGAAHDEKWIVPLAAAQHPGRRRRPRGKVPPLATGRFSVDAHGRLVIERAQVSTSGERRADGKEDAAEETQTTKLRTSPDAQAEAQAEA